MLRLPDGQATAAPGEVARGPAAAVCVNGVRGAQSHRPSETQGVDRASPGSVTPSCSPTSLQPTRGSSATRTGACSRFSTRRSWRACSKYMLDETEFLGPHGIRSLSRYHLDHPFSFWVGPHEYTVQYLPAESNTGMFGGNSNWRGPVWMPVNVLIIRALLNLYSFYGDDFTVECPTGSGQHMTLFEVRKELTRRIVSAFLRNADGKRPIYGARPSLPERSALARPDPLPRVLPRRQRSRARAPATRPGGQASSRRCSTSSGDSTRRRSSRPSANDFSHA